METTKNPLSGRRKKGQIGAETAPFFLWDNLRTRRPGVRIPHGVPPRNRCTATASGFSFIPVCLENRRRCKAEPLPIVCCRYTSSFFFSTRRSVSANAMLPASASSSRHPHRAQAGAFRARLFSSQLLEKKHKSRYNRENTGGAGMHQRKLEKGSSVVPILQSICQWAGVFYKDEGEVPMIQCHKCDHRG